MSDRLYNLGYLGASNSNIGLGYASIVFLTIHGYMADEDPSNIDRVGHRRWILSPYLPEVGFGYYNLGTVMYVIAENYQKDIPYYETIKLPVEGIMPQELFADNAPWSIYLNSKDYVAAIEKLKVKFTINGELIELTKANKKDFYLDRSNFSYSSPTLIFRSNEIREIQYGDCYDVEITGLTDKAGNPKKIQ